MTKRVYSNEKSVGSVFEKDGRTLAVIDLGPFLGKTFLDVKEDDKGNWDLTMSVVTTDGNKKEIKMGKAFKSDKYDFIRKYTIPLGRKWNKETSKEEIDNEDIIVLTFVMLKEPIITKKGSKKIGFVTRQIGIIPRENNKITAPDNVPVDNDVDDEDIPF